MVQFLSINFFLGFLQFLLGFSKVPVLLCQPVLCSPTCKHILYANTVRETLREIVIDWMNGLTVG